MDDKPPASPPVDGLDVPALQAELRRTACAATAPVLGTPSLTQYAIAASLEQIKQHIEVGKGAPELKRFRPALRTLARWLARTLLYALRFLTNRLRRLHHAQLNALQHLHRGLTELEQRTQQDQQRQAAEYRQELQRLHAQVEELRRTLATPSQRAA